MKRQSARTGFVVVLCTILLAGSLGVSLHLMRQAQRTEAGRHRSVQIAQSVRQSADDTASSAIPQVVVGTPEFYGEPVRERYHYRNDYDNPQNFNELLPLYLIDKETSQEIRMGNALGSAAYSGQNDEYLLWHFFCSTSCGGIQQGLHAYAFETGVDHFIAPMSTSIIHPQILGEWIAFGHYWPEAQLATLYAGNIQTHEVITLTENLWAPNAMVNGYFGIGAALAAWYDPPDGIIVYDLQHQRELMRITNLFSAFNESPGEIYGVSAGETVVTWNRSYGYDLVTQSYFSLSQIIPQDGAEPYVTMSRIHEADRILSWSFTYADGTRRDVRAPLLDATPSTAPCIADQNLVQNGDFEDADAHSLWQQRDNIANLLINDAPPGLASGGDWALRLGRFADSHAAIQQQLDIPSGVKELTLTFDVRAHSWDLWGGDRLQLDLVDPLSGRSLLATPVQWTNVQLASGDWIPMQVAIQNWLGIDTPLQLVFRAQTDWAFPTDFTVDNIQLTTTCVRQ